MTGKKKKKQNLVISLLLLKFSTEKNQTAFQHCWWYSWKGEYQHIYNKIEYMQLSLIPKSKLAT